MAISVGIDLVAIDEIRASLRRHGERYLKRVYTEGEQRECRGDPRRLAGRFAAKEATAKALRAGGEPLPWHSIAVAEDAGGRPSVRLTGEAAALADRLGILTLSLSLTLSKSAAMAVVLADLDAGVSGWPGSGRGTA